MSEIITEGTTMPKVEKTFEEIVADIEECITLNRANTLAFLECLRLCREEGSYQEIESRLVDLPAVALSTQTPHTLIDILISRGGIIKTFLEAEDAIETVIPEEALDGVDEAVGEEGNNDPLDYLLKTSDAGLEVLNRFDPFRRLETLVLSEPEQYQKLHIKMLSLCSQNTTLAQINEELGSESALFSPKRIYPEYFISKLETVGGLEWKGAWSTTQAGKDYLAFCGPEFTITDGSSVKDR